MVQLTHDLDLPTAEATAEFGTRIAGQLAPGDTILLSGDIGAGKTFLARNVIWALLDTPEDVPSPTFTLIQTYETRLGLLHHTDLYRLSGPDDIVELGLLEAFGTEICLIEWPDRLGPDAPIDALCIDMRNGADIDARQVQISCQSSAWDARMKGLFPNDCPV